MITAVIVDDESPAIERMAELVASFRDVELIGTARDAAAAQRLLSERMPDVVFLDIDMPGGDGLDLAGRVPGATRIVFVTAHEDRALDAFRLGAIDYVLKPVDRDRLAITIDRLQRQRAGVVPTTPQSQMQLMAAMPAAQEGEEAAAGEPVMLELAVDQPGAVLVTLAGSMGVEKLAFADIAWIESHRNYTFVHTRGRPRLLVRSTLSQWEALLPQGPFGRISRSLLVHVAAIQALRWRSRDETLVLFRGLDTPLPVGRAATTRLKGLLGQ